MGSDNIMIFNEENEGFDKMKIAVAIRNSTFGEELQCSLLSNRIIDNCSYCNLKIICEGIGEVEADYKDKTTFVVNNFTFN